MFKRKSISLPLIMTYSMLLNAGSSCIWPLVTIYINNYLHESLTLSGAALLGMSIFMIIGNYVGGYLFDNWSAYKTSLIFILISTLAVVALIFFHGWPAFGLLLMPFGLGNGANLTLTNAYATAIVSKSSRYIFNIMYIGLNLGIVIGTAMVGFLLKKGITFLFIVTGLFYLALLLMTVFRFNVDFSKYNSVHGNQSRSKASHHVVPLVWLICIMSLSVYLSYALWDSVMSVHMTDLGISFIKYSWIWVVNGLMIVIGQAWVNRIFSHMKMYRQIALGIAIFALSFFGLIWVRSYPWFIADMVMVTIGEMIGIPNLPAWLDEFASNGEKGRYQAYFNVFMTSGRAMGPLVDGLLIESVGYSFLFSFSGGIVLFTLLLVMLGVHKRNERKLS